MNSKPRLKTQRQFDKAEIQSQFTDDNNSSSSNGNKSNGISVAYGEANVWTADGLVKIWWMSTSLLWGRVCVSSLLQFGQVRGFNYQFNAVRSIRTTHFRNQFNNVINGRICPKLPSLTRPLLSVLFTRTSPTFTSLFGSSPINSLASHYQLPISNFPSRFAILHSLLFLAYWL